MGLEPVAGSAAVGRALSAVAVQDDPSQFGRDGSGGGTDGQGGSPRGAGEDLNRAAAEDLFEGEGTDPRTHVDVGSGFPAGGGGEVSVDEDRHQRLAGGLGDRGSTEGILGDGDQRIGVPL